MRQGAVAVLFCAFTLLSPISLPSTYASEGDWSLSEVNPSYLTFDNGLTLIIKEDHRTPTFAASLFIKTGSATEGEYIGSGITHCIEHMIFKGTPTRTPQQVQAQIKALGGSIGAYTSLDHTSFKLQGPSEKVEPIMDIFFDIIANPAFDDKEFEKEQNVIKREMRMLNDNPDRYLSQQLWQIAYLTHPYRNPIIGYEDIFERLTTQDLHRYYGRFYVPDNMILVVVGDIDSDNLKERLAVTFGSLQRKSFLLPVTASENQQVTPRYREVPYATSKTHLLIGFHSVSATDRDLYALDTLAMLLGSGRSSILYEELHNRQKLVNQIGANNYTPFDQGLFLITATFDPANKDKVIRSIFDEIEKIKKSTLDNKELDKAKNQVISSYIFSKQTQQSQADDLGVSQMIAGDTEFSKRYVEGVNALTTKDIMATANRYLRQDAMSTAVLLPKGLTDQAAPAVKAVASERKVVKRQLRNGMRLIICEDKNLPIVSMRVCMQGGLRSENNYNNGISNMTAQMLTKGAKNMKEEDIFAFIESLGGGLSAYSGNNSLGLSIDIMSKDLDKGMGLLRNVLTSPTFPKDKLEVLKNDILSQLELIDDDVFGSAERELRGMLFNNHPYGMISLGTKESVGKLDRRDIVDFYKGYCVGENIVLSISGDIDSEAAYKKAAWYFGGIRKRQEPPVKDITLDKIDKRIELRRKMDKEQSVLMVGFRSVGLQDPDRYPLQVLASIFSGPAGRLFTNIRQQKGLAYTTGVFGMVGIDEGSFIFYAATSAENIDLAKEEIFAQIREVCEGKVSDEEISSAKISLISSDRIGLQDTGAFAMEMALDELYGLGFENYKDYPAKIDKITRQDVIQAANKYFTVDNCVVSITVPSGDE